jgi:predicted ATPase
MLTSLNIKGFRCFETLAVDALDRVNLFVGKNNAGKSSLLDAVELLATGDPETLAHTASRRGEVSARETNKRQEFDLRHAFHGRGLDARARFSIEATATDGSVRHASVRAVPTPESKRRPEVGAVSLQFDRTDGTSEILPLGPGGTVISWGGMVESRDKVVHLPAVSLPRLWESIVLTPEEVTVVAAMQAVEPDIERVALVGNIFYVKLTSSAERVPMGNLGDGTTRLFVLACGLVGAAQGVLLVDDIDRGLHHTVMESMWRMLITTAQRLNVQVFATAHASDAVHAIGYLYEEHRSLADACRVHRIERDAPTTVAYSADDLAVAAKHHLEVR